MVTRRGPRGTDYCVLCNPGGYGKVATQDPDATAIAQYYIDPRFNEPPTGWQPVCEMCLEITNWESAGFQPEPLEGHEDHPHFQDGDEPLEHDCEDFRWEKKSLVTEEGGFDWVECTECGARAKRHGMGSIELIEVPSPNASFEEVNDGQ